MGTRIKEDCYIKVIRTIQKYKLIHENDKIVIAVSGGPDSMCLLEILRKLKQESCQNGTSPLATFDFVVAHVNHMIREEAKEDEAFVKNYCMKFDIRFFGKGIDVQHIANTNKMSIEEAGRYARYHFFDEVLQKIGGNKIAIAHNKNDKVETMIMNALRGCGVQGLKGIEPIRDKYIRPLIECDRKEIEAYCEEQQIVPRIDKTNFENVYTRNKIRNIMIPYIEKEFNPNFIESMNRLSNIVSEQEEYIQKQVENVYNHIVIEENFYTNLTGKNSLLEQTTDAKVKQTTEQTIKQMTEQTTEYMAKHTIEQTNMKDRKYAKDEEYIILNLKGFNTQEKVIKSNIILYTITRLFHTTKGIEKIHIEDIIKLCENNVGNKFLKPNKHLKIFIKNGKIKISKEV